MKIKNFVVSIEICCLIIVLFFGFLIRFIGSFQGYPNYWHPDEWRIVLETLSMANERTIIPANVNYPMYFRYIILFVYTLLYAISYLFGVVKNTLDFGVLFFNHYEIFLIIPRLLNVVFGTVTIYLIYIATKKIFGYKTAMWAMFLAAIELSLVTHTQVGLHQTASYLTQMIVFYFAHRLMERGSQADFILFGTSFGVAIGTHQTSILLVPAIIYALAVAVRKTEYKTRSLISFLIYSFFFGILGNLHYVFKPQESIEFFRLGSELSQIGFSSHQVFSNTLLGYYQWLVKEVFYQDYLIGILIVGGLMSAIFRRRNIDWFYIITIFAYGIFYKNWAYWWLHLMVGVIPITLVFAGSFFESLTNRWRVNLQAFILLLICAPSMLTIYSLLKSRTSVDTRQLASEWVIKNIPQNSTIAVDWPAYSLNLNFQTPLYLLNPVGKKYYDQQLSPDIKNRIIRSDNKYTVLEAMYSSSKPEWPKTMSESEIKLGESSTVYRNLFGYFNFLSLDKILKDADYLVISSYSYTMFLKDGDSYKNNLFNPFFRDRMYRYYSHPEFQNSPVDDNLIYFSAQKGRDFYEPLLRNQVEGYKLIKMFKSDTGFQGPDIMIYKTAKVDEKKN